jgi:acid phosphatase (class A)
MLPSALTGIALLITSALVLAKAPATQTPGGEPTAGQTPARPAPARAGFLQPAQMPDVLRIVPPAPKAGDSRFTADMAVFRATRSLQGSPRWAMATADDDITTANLLRTFQCALDVAVTPANAPRLTSLVSRANIDANRASNTIKQFYLHPRPFQVEDAAVCVSPTRRDVLSQSADYPSGHTTISWETALVLSQVAPDRESAILTRARAYGESRIICGVHNMSAVEAGWMTASAVFAAQQPLDDFQQAIKDAKAELAQLRLTGSVEPAACSTEAQLVAERPF